MTVAVVEDNRRIAELYVDLLQTLGHTAHAFFDGESFLEAFPGLGPDLVVLDRGLPGCDGLEVAHRVRTLRPEVPILMVSGNPPARTDVAGVIDEVLAKPCTITQFIDAVSTLVARSRSGVET
jgi:DNA-binding response OmpR family regulator